MGLIQKEKAYGDYVMLFTILSLLVLLFGYAVIVKLGAPTDRLGKSFFVAILDKSNFMTDDSAAALDSGSNTYTLHVLICGDGIVDYRYEDCDDMNDDVNDGCHECRII